MKKTAVIFKQKEVLANFYANFALIWLTYGVVAPFFTTFKELVENYLIFIIRFIISMIVAKIFLNISFKIIK